MLEPLGDRIIVSEVQEKVDKTKPSLHISSGVQSPTIDVVIHSVGPGLILESGEVMSIDKYVHKGDIVKIPFNSGTDVGGGLMVVPFRSVLCVVCKGGQ